MSGISKSVAVAAIVVAALHGGAAKAGTPYQGIYVIVDPYMQSQTQLLKTAAQTPCSGQQTATTPFCGATNGLLLRIAWCDFQLYHVTNAQNTPYPSCHYTVGYTGAVGSAGVELPTSDTVSPCSGSFDICAGHATSVLGTTLHYINQINTQRANAGLPPLKLSVGLYAGIGTPQGILDSMGSVDVPYNTSITGDPTAVQCYRLPLAWKPQFISAYDSAVDQMLSYMQSQFPNGTNIVILKAAGITARDLELTMPGQAMLVAAPADVGQGAGPGPALGCQNNVQGAQIWLNAYNQAPNNNQTFAQANEAAFGTIIGHEMGTLANLGLKNTLISIPTTDSRSFAQVDCGTSGAGACSVHSGEGNFSDYYFELYVLDMFNGGLAWSQANAAYDAMRTDTFSFAPAQLSLNWTGLSPTPISSSSQIECTLNNITATNEYTFALDSQLVSVIGAGTGLGWQTNVNEGGECSSNQYAQTMQNGLTAGGQFIEVETDAAFTDIAQCSPYLTSALTQILAQPSQTTCAY